MLLLQPFFALIFALVLSGLFALATRRSLQRPGFLWLFLIIFLVIWAGGIWTRPFGPSVGGISWLPFLLVGIIFVLILAVSAPRLPPRGRHDTIDMLERIEREKKLDQFTYIYLGAVFWILLILLTAAIVIHYL
jgi:hypothetical protein